MKSKVLTILTGFILMTVTAWSQTQAGQEPGARQEVIDWLNQKFSVYKLRNPDFPDKPIEKIIFDSCYIQADNVYDLNDGKIETKIIDYAKITNIDYYELHGGMLSIKYGTNVVYISFDAHQEPGILRKIKNSIAYLKTYCINNTGTDKL